ncbi:hypothetical protein G6F57_020887 [Rhizopus arrhizus]|nr:hypothetical protein G6F57_020887 [Rhizopus arrhizus]
MRGALLVDGRDDHGRLRLNDHVQGAALGLGQSLRGGQRGRKDQCADAEGEPFLRFHCEPPGWKGTDRGTTGEAATTMLHTGAGARRWRAPPWRQAGRCSRLPGPRAWRLRLRCGSRRPCTARRSWRWA